ncbi:TetR/AcrR family transcriptional regulator [Pseudolabrys sp. FHR47]|uniref:TetR/AcrR family transcriptional regulator n=1 Tax=Pseudolabrys sp. FHR47 TaxID=2562284 RepID=UPI00143D149B|nr:TetR/AcrR family transcriptional regulator [Pseudolabrys sp. FHR47]
MATVDAVHEAAIQVLLRDGAERLTTTRVAERAGVSVGTLYQYYPNKQALLCAVLEIHLGKVADAVTAACESARGKAMSDIVERVVEAYLDAKMARRDISMALYRIAAEIDGAAVARRSLQKSVKSLEQSLRTAPDFALSPGNFAAQMMIGAIAGSTRAVLEAGASPAMVRNLRHHLVLMCRCYLAAVGSCGAAQP